MCKAKHKFRNRVSKREDNVFGGILLLAIGSILFARQAGAQIPAWLFTWPMIPIVVGMFVGIKTRFRDFGWVIMIGIGLFFLLDRSLDSMLRDYLFPAFILGAGVLVLLTTFFNKKRIVDEEIIPDTADEIDGEQTTMAVHRTRSGKEDDVMEVISVFGSAKRVVLSKNFKGGEVVSIFGSSEINLTNADFNGRLVLEVVQIFGGTKLIIPPHWEVQSKTAVFFGGIEDKRSAQTMGNPEKILVLEGTTIFGGVTIASY